MRLDASVRIAAPLFLLAGGCSTDFLPASYLHDLRVIAIVATPLEAGPGDTVALVPTVYAPPGSVPVSRSWTFCPVTAGSAMGYACAVPQCQTSLTSAADGSASANPHALALQCASTFGTGGTVPPEVPDVVQSTFTYEVVQDIRLPDGTFDRQRRVAVQTVPLWTRGPPVSPNLPPAIASVEIGGVPAAAAGPVPEGGEAPVHVRIDPASVQTYVDASGRSVQETMTVSYFTTAGRFQYDRQTGIDVSVDLQAVDLAPLPADAESRVWVVARDLRGGQAVLGPFTVPFAR
jgi:hypothetical protein